MEHGKYGVENKHWYTSEDIHATYTHGFWTGAGLTTAFWIALLLASAYILGAYG